MRTLYCQAIGLICLGAVAVIGSAPLKSQEYYNYNQNYNNRHGLDLPSVPIPNGQDEVRAADGTTCKTTVASNGSYFDSGVIGSNDRGAFSAGGVYARVIVPLGRKPARIDCSQLFQLEIERLRLELELTRMGLGGMGKAALAASKSAPAPPEAWAPQPAEDNAPPPPISSFSTAASRPK